MQDKEALQEIEGKVVEKLTGRLNLLQTEEQKKRVVSDAIEEICGHVEKDLLFEEIHALKTEGERKEFVKSFLSYDVIQELLWDPDIEDIIINSLKPIFVDPEEDPILLEITIDSPPYQELNFQTEIAFDPESLVKGMPPHPRRGVPMLIPLIIGVSVGGIIVAAGVYIYFKRRER